MIDDDDRKYSTFSQESKFEEHPPVSPIIVTKNKEVPSKQQKKQSFRAERKSSKEQKTKKKSTSLRLLRRSTSRSLHSVFEENTRTHISDRKSRRITLGINMRTPKESPLAKPVKANRRTYSKDLENSLPSQKNEATADQQYPSQNKEQGEHEEENKPTVTHQQGRKSTTQRLSLTWKKKDLDPQFSTGSIEEGSSRFRVQRKFSLKKKTSSLSVWEQVTILTKSGKEVSYWIHIKTGEITFTNPQSRKNSSLAWTKFRGFDENGKSVIQWVNEEAGEVSKTDPHSRLGDSDDEE